MNQSDEFSLIVVHRQQLQRELLLYLLRRCVHLDLDLELLIVEIRLLDRDLLGLRVSGACLLDRLHGVNAALVLRNDHLLLRASLRGVGRALLLLGILRRRLRAGLLLEDSLHLHSDTLWNVDLDVVHDRRERGRALLTAHVAIQLTWINDHLRPVGDQVLTRRRRMVPLGPARLSLKVCHAVALHPDRVAQLSPASAPLVQADAVRRLLHLVHVLVGALVHLLAAAVVRFRLLGHSLLRREDVLLAAI